MYEFAVAKHTDNPAKIEVGRPHDLNPASYEDTKKIVREESVKAGISKYGAGKRSWFAFVCDGSPYKNFLSLFNVLFFCTSCKKPCGEMKKHVNDKHGGKTDHIQMEFDHVLPQFCDIFYFECFPYHQALPNQRSTQSLRGIR